MKYRCFFSCSVSFPVWMLSAWMFLAAPASAQGTGTIQGRVRLNGDAPGSPLIRMGMDPKCAEMNAAQPVFQRTVAADIHNDLANVFVKVDGKFPETPVSSQPVVIDQRKCMFEPRVVGVRVGQTLEVKNGDTIAHSVHGVSAGANSFNTTILANGAPFTFKPKQDEVIRIVCDLHRWMVAYAGVTNNPYFAVTGASGTFQIAKVPAGTYTVEAWQEEYGWVKKTVTVPAGGVAIVNFTYTAGKEKPSGHRGL